MTPKLKKLLKRTELTAWLTALALSAFGAVVFLSHTGTKALTELRTHRIVEQATQELTDAYATCVSENLKLRKEKSHGNPKTN